jgi:hypothetical protein
VKGLRVALAPVYVDVAIAIGAWICGGLYWFSRYGHVRFYLLKLVLYFSVAGGLVIFAAALVMVLLNRALHRWVHSSESTSHAGPLVPWLIRVAGYSAEVVVILWLARYFVLFGM